MDKKIISDLETFVKSEFSKDYFTIIYGSYAYGINKPYSDLDFVTVTKNFSQDNLKYMVEFALDLHRKYGLALDDEVPHEKKLLANYKTLDNAINGKGFEIKDGSIYVPPVVKTKEFLNSDEIAMRLLLNAITSKNIFVSGDLDYYLQKRKQALKNMVGFMFLIEGVDSFTISEFVQSLIGTQKRHGEMYLGYKDKPTVRAYLTVTFEQEFERLTSSGTLIYDPDKLRYYLRDISWLNNLVDQNAKES